MLNLLEDMYHAGLAPCKAQAVVVRTFVAYDMVTDIRTACCLYLPLGVHGGSKDHVSGKGSSRFAIFVSACHLDLQRVRFQIESLVSTMLEPRPLSLLVIASSISEPNHVSHRQSRGS